MQAEPLKPSPDTNTSLLSFARHVKCITISSSSLYRHVYWGAAYLAKKTLNFCDLSAIVHISVISRADLLCTLYSLCTGDGTAKQRIFIFIMWFFYSILFLMGLDIYVKISAAPLLTRSWWKQPASQWIVYCLLFTVYCLLRSLLFYATNNKRIFFPDIVVYAGILCRSLVIRAVPASKARNGFNYS